jgi:hypothetical protein
MSAVAEFAVEELYDTRRASLEGKIQVGIIPICVSSDGRKIP